MRALHVRFAAELAGLDLASGTKPEVPAEIARTIDAHALLVVRDQGAFNDACQIRLSAAFGQVQR